MNTRLSEDERQVLIDDADLTITRLKRLINDYYFEMLPEYLQDVEHAIEIIEYWRGVIDG